MQSSPLLVYNRPSFRILSFSYRFGHLIKFDSKFSLKSSAIVDLDRAAAIENDETMIISSDHTIITTPVESPQNDIDAKAGLKLKLLNGAIGDEATTSDTSSGSDPVVKAIKNHRPKARSDSTRSSKYANRKPKFCLFFWTFC